MKTKGHHDIANDVGELLLNKYFSSSSSIGAFYLGNWLTDVRQIIDPIRDISILAKLDSEIKKKLEDMANSLTGTYLLINMTLDAENISRLIKMRSFKGAAEAADFAKNQIKILDDFYTQRDMVITQVLDFLRVMLTPSDIDNERSSIFSLFAKEIIFISGFFKFVFDETVSENIIKVDFSVYEEIFFDGDQDKKDKSKVSNNESAFSQYYPHEHLDRPAILKQDFFSGGKPIYEPGLQVKENVKQNQPDEHKLYEYLQEQIMMTAGILAEVDQDFKALAREGHVGKGYGTPPATLAKLGHALHQVEDFFAHTNWIEQVALRFSSDIKFEKLEKDATALWRRLARYTDVLRTSKSSESVSDDQYLLVDVGGAGPVPGLKSKITGRQYANYESKIVSGFFGGADGLISIMHFFDNFLIDSGFFVMSGLLGSNDWEKVYDIFEDLVSLSQINWILPKSVIQTIDEVMQYASEPMPKNFEDVTREFCKKLFSIMSIVDLVLSVLNRTPASPKAKNFQRHLTKRIKHYFGVNVDELMKNPKKLIDELITNCGIVNKVPEKIQQIIIKAVYLWVVVDVKDIFKEKIIQNADPFHILTTEAGDRRSLIKYLYKTLSFSSYYRKYKLVKAAQSATLGPEAFAFWYINQIVKSLSLRILKIVFMVILRHWVRDRFDQYYDKLGAETVGSHSLLAKDDEASQTSTLFYVEQKTCAKAVHWFVVNTLLRWQREEERINENKFTREAPQSHPVAMEYDIDWLALLTFFLSHPYSFSDKNFGQSKKEITVVKSFTIDRKINDLRKVTVKHKPTSTSKFFSFEEIARANFWLTLPGKSQDEDELEKPSPALSFQNVTFKEGKRLLIPDQREWLAFFTSPPEKKLQENPLWFVDVLTDNHWEIIQTTSKEPGKNDKNKYYTPKENKKQQQFIDEVRALRKDTRHKYSIFCDELKSKSKTLVKENQSKVLKILTSLVR